jgi:hypothetical protein
VSRFSREAIEPSERRQAEAAARFTRSVLAATLFTSLPTYKPRLTFDKAGVFARSYDRAREAWNVQAAPQQARSRPDAQMLSQALVIAWDLLVAADDPATANERADETRRKMARHLVDAAANSDDVTDLWLAALNAVVDGNAFRRAS